MVHAVLGIDLTAGPQRPSACAALDDTGAVAGLVDLRTDEELLALAGPARVVAIDAPLGLPAGWCCLEPVCACGGCESPTEDRRRAAELALRDAGIPCYWTTRRSIIRRMVYRGIALRNALEAQGKAVLEVYPYGAKLRLWGRPLPKKTAPAGLAFLKERLAALWPSLVIDGAFTHDHADALLAAYTGWLHLHGSTDVLGTAAEGQIVLPKTNLSAA